jgi:hypothetical protein
MWRNTLNGVLGLAIILIAFLGLSGPALMWTLAISGILIAIVGFSGSMYGSSYDQEQRHSLR